MEINSRLTWRSKGTDHNPNGVDLMAEDWDYCIILDALRYDVMEEECSLPGELRQVESRGAGTREWLRGNFRGEEFPDTVYINVNPQLDELADELGVRFHAVESIWQEEWDEDLKTVPPAPVKDRAIEFAEEYPHKRLLIHFVQPHDPFIGPFGREAGLSGKITPDDSEYMGDWGRAFVESVRLKDTEAFEKAYRENVRIVLEHVEELLEELDGKVVVTSDHGELMGERVRPIPIRYVGHRIGCHHPALLSVPWLEYESGPRREIEAGDAVEYERAAESDTVRDRLQQLGYVG